VTAELVGLFACMKPCPYAADPGEPAVAPCPFVPLPGFGARSSYTSRRSSNSSASTASKVSVTGPGGLVPLKTFVAPLFPVGFCASHSSSIVLPSIATSDALIGRPPMVTRWKKSGLFHGFGKLMARPGQIAGATSPPSRGTRRTEALP
jgi:hypothetical protein